VAQNVDPEFKPQYCRGKKETKKNPNVNLPYLSGGD
jgi:hypothetical protein